MAALIVVHSESNADQQFELPSSGATIGRGDGCQIQTEDIGVSRRHARITLSPEGWSVEDLGSTNGTFVNDVEIKRSLLREPDFLKVGAIIFKFVDSPTSDRMPSGDPGGSNGGAPAFVYASPPGRRRQ